MQFSSERANDPKYAIVSHREPSVALIEHLMTLIEFKNVAGEIGNTTGAHASALIHRKWMERVS